MVMYRNSLKDLKAWLISEFRKPLVLRGARQVGKTWLVRELAKEMNKHLVELNFEKQRELSVHFESNNPTTILLNLESALGLSIHPENSLLFFDEIQAAPQLFAKLRWFYEAMPNLPVIAAGSLLEFVLERHEFSMPVGRVNYFFIEPLGFDEFLMAKNLVKNKIANQLALLAETEKLKDFKELEKSILNQIEATTDSQQLLGLEGNMSKQFFPMYFSSIKWRRRSPRTKQDIPNFLMDIGYTFLFNFIEALLKLHGFDTYKGFYHKLFFQRKSLACDIMEPMRCLIDKQILKSYNLKQIKDDDFKIEGGKYVLPFENNAKYAGLFMQAMMDRKEDIFSFVHDFYRFMMCPKKNKFPEFKIKV